MSSGNEPEKRSVEAGRRRRPEQAPPGGRERAETPQRREESGGRGDSGGGSASGGRTGMSLPGGKGCLGGSSIIVIILIIAIVFGIQYCGGSNEGEISTSDTTSFVSSNYGQIGNLDNAAPFASNFPSTTLKTASTKSGQTWLVMLYQDADDKILEQDIYLDVNEAEKAGSSDRVKIVAQVDRYNGAYSGDGNWTGAKRFLISRDDNLGGMHSQEIADLGEVNMSSGQTLVDFATWAIQTYPADKYALLMSDHGMGWPGGWSDSTPKGGVDASVPLESRIGDMLYLNELDDALGQIRSKTKLDKFELVGLDACLMGQLEVFTTLEPHARYAVASQEVEPALGWAYTGFLSALNQNPGMDGSELSRLIVESYIEDDQRIVDNTARADFLSQGSPFGGLFGQSSSTSSEQLAREIGQSSTLTAIDLSKINQLNASLNQLVYAFQKTQQNIIASSRTYAQSFTSVWGSEVPPSYIDLGNFLQILKQKSGASEISQPTDVVLAAIKQAVIAEKHGPQKPGATGVAIYFPNSQLYQNAITGAQSYTTIANRFAVQSLWDDFLAYHYAGQKFVETDVRAVIPPSGSIRAPSVGGITISPVTASSVEAAPGQPVKLSADISGENIGYIYLFAGFYDQQANSVFVADQDYLESPNTHEVNGIYYPDWGQGEFTLNFSWEPVVFAINDGTKSVTSLFKPENYGRSYEEATYTVDGIYTYADSGEQRQARLYFVNGVLRQVFGFTGEGETGAPREITPSTGDTFTVLESWLDLNNSGQVINNTSQPGDTLMFGGQMFTWKTLDAAAGNYVIGFVVEDLDGNQQQSLTRITVK
jgi:hypothetical protein